MTANVVVYGFETSNNMKVRVALGLKGVEYEFREISPGDRTEILRVSGQHLTPVLVHGDRVLFDSASILRYLDTAFPEAAKLFGQSRDEQWSIEDWELHARSALAGPMMEIVHGRVQGKELDAKTMTRCNRSFGEAVSDLAEGLDGREWLVGSSMTAADITAAAVLHRIQVAELLQMPPTVSLLEDWKQRVMAFDGVGRQ